MQIYAFQFSKSYILQYYSLGNMIQSTAQRWQSFTDIIRLYLCNIGHTFVVVLQISKRCLYLEHFLRKKYFEKIFPFLGSIDVFGFILFINLNNFYSMKLISKYFLFGLKHAF